MSYKSYEEVESGPLADKLRSTNNQLVFPELFVKFGPTKCFLPRSFANYVDAITSFNIRENDIWVVTYPKSGTTWTQEMVWLIANDLDYEGAKKRLHDRSPFFEVSAWSSGMQDGLNGELIPNTEEDGSEGLSSIESVRQLKSPRVVKSHLPYYMLPKGIREKKPKLIYVARDPKDVCVSFYHHRVHLEKYLGNIGDLVEEFIAGLCLYGPYWPHVKEFWDIRHQPNILFLKYEDMKNDLTSIVETVAEFLGKSLNEYDKTTLVNHLSFENMKKNPSANQEEVTDLFFKLHGTETKYEFLRKGKVGSWKEELSPQQVKLLDSWITENQIEGLYPSVPSSLIK